ncbi:plexin domain-containing protein 2 [Topomyia yanbarensis]|uniref:plexin domain-containing protein 2 n=1 Tax=Topomyia yanbarensis TaxID=2498891 RepID=UPI00273C6D90|nr:plexin domain-containing protein 2 [Topomyia yanbarensis]XP_058837279.1 plexin domain-containing protein 2 [Topomyia yanbarensis]
MAMVNGAMLKSALFLLILLADCRVNYAEDSSVPLRVRRSKPSDPPTKSSGELETLDSVQMFGHKPPISENKTSVAKQKLMNENLTGKKPLNLNSSTVYTDHLLGYNGTGQRREFSIVSIKPGAEPTTVSTPSGGSAINVSVEAKSGLGVAKLGGSTSTVDPLSDAINIDTVERSEADLNTTLQNHNITYTQEDYHTYYNSVWTTDKSASDAYWNRLDNMNVSSLLSNSHRRATTVLLSFDFPYYGYPIRNITIATGGFLYTGDYVHSWLASTQYIAPLMANFDTSLSNYSFVKFRDDGETFTVVWENVSLQDRPENGSFMFSATLNKSGDIVFAYKIIPIDIQQIYDDKHPVKVGLSDAYIIDKTIFRTKQKTIYEYHRVNFGRSKVQNNTLITLYAQPTCFSFKDCQSCMIHEGAEFKCIWCPTLNRCSTGVDRKRQDWIQKGCDKTQIMDITVCPALGQKGNNYGEPVEISTEGSEANGTYRHETEIQLSKNVNNKSGTSGDDGVNKVPAFHVAMEQHSSSSSLLVSMMVICGILLSCGCWVLYAYRNPHTKSGQLLIRYRPNKWSWRRGEARYTAATIHM